LQDQFSNFFISFAMRTIFSFVLGPPFPLFFSAAAIPSYYYRLVTALKNFLMGFFVSRLKLATHRARIVAHVVADGQSGIAFALYVFWFTVQDKALSQLGNRYSHFVWDLAQT
jgi:hypothetical protein